VPRSVDTPRSSWVSTAAPIRKKRWLRDAREGREHAHHARHAKHASYENCRSNTPMRNARGVCTAYERRRKWGRRYSERTACGEWQKQHSQWHKAGTDRSIGTHSRLNRYSMCKHSKRQQPAQTQTTHQPNPLDPRTRSHPRNSKCGTHGGTIEYGAAAGSGDDDGCEKRRLAMAKTWQER
jgi:hypothetical protein